MSKLFIKSMARFFLFFLAISAFTSCAGEDYTPVYFQPQGDEETKNPSHAETVPGRQCSLSFISQLCVVIKGDKIEVGTKQDDLLCTEVPAFPIHISGSKVTIKGSEFPDLKVEGHGLPAPITINARGLGDGSANTGEGKIDAGGNISVQNFSLFIVALGAVGEIKTLTLTTGTTDELPDLPSTTGSPPDASGAMTLVTGTILGHTIDAADKYMMGASLTATFKGSITPPLSQCGGAGKRSIEVKKLTITEDGSFLETPIPENQRMEISDGTYIPAAATDIGDLFETTKKFRVKNIGTKAQTLQIPSRTGPFYLNSKDSLTMTLLPSQSFMLDVTFKPSSDDVPDKVEKILPIGADQFTLIGKAKAKSGKPEVDVVDDNGKITLPEVDGVSVGESTVHAITERDFFNCKEIKCGDSKSWTNCKACEDPTTTPCELLTISTAGKPFEEVNDKCELIDPDAAPLLGIDLKGSAGNGETQAVLAGHKQVLALRNRGTTKITITKIKLAEIAQSKSKGQFSMPKNAIFLSRSYDTVKEEVAKALAGKAAQGATLPVELPPFQPGYNESTLYIVVTYTPSDLIGADGEQAGIGSKATDKAIVKITTDTGEIITTVTGTTTIQETPALELYFKTSTGLKQVLANGSFPFKGVTTSTIDLAVPLFLRVSDGAAHTLRITSISMEGGDTANFKWLDTQEKIAAVKPPSGKGMRCSIPIVDESTGTMIGESFDLKPSSVTPPGLDIAPGAYTTGSMPLLGCVNFHRDEKDTTKKRIFETKLVVSAQELDVKGSPIKNPDGSYRQMDFAILLLAAINPKSGKLVLRVTQSMAVILNPKFPGLSSISSREDMAEDLASGKVKQIDLQLFTGSLILDPFDEMSIKTSDGKEIVSKPNDGVTAVFRALDTHPISKNYDDDRLFDYASLTFDSVLPAGSQGIYEDYPNAEGARTNGWRIFTSTLSYPGPVGPEERKSDTPSACKVVNPCDAEDLKGFTDEGYAEEGRGACAFFYASGARYDSSAYHSSKEMQGGDYDKLCNRVNKPQNLKDINTGSYSVDGSLTFEEVGLRFFGPTYFHNPSPTALSKSPLDEIFYLGFTTEVLKPPSGPNDLNVLPDKKINLAKNEFKINLNDKTMESPPICPNNTKNKLVRGKYYSSWKFLSGLLYKDEAATIPAGCPEDGNGFTGGQAFLKGRNVNQENGVLTIVAGAKFSSSDDLSFAFKDVMMFTVLNGWLCDPEGDEKNFEGKLCYDLNFNDHDAESQISITK